MTETDSERADHKVSTLQWVISGVAVVVVLGAFGLVLRAALSDGPQRPALRATADSITASDNGYLVYVTVANRGEGTAADVTLEGELVAGEAASTAQVMIDYVPARSSRAVTLGFPTDPRRGRLSLRFASYTEP